MNAVVFYSNTGESRAIAQYFANSLAYPLIAIERARTIEKYEDLVLVFPVHCQGIPDAVKRFLTSASAKRTVAVATYGKMHHGNVLYELQRKYNHNVIAAAYVPTKHSYIRNDTAFSDYGKLGVITEKLKAPAEVRLPRLFKNPLAALLPKFRGLIGLKIQRSSACDGCEVCSAVCPLPKSAIKSGKTNGNCIRCLRCVNACPKGALDFRLSLPLRLYLRKKKKNKLIVYV